MTEKKEQKILVIIEQGDNDQSLIKHGIKLAFIFKKELCLFFHASSGKKQQSEARELLNNYARRIKSEIPVLPVSSLVLFGDKSSVPDVLAEDHEAILLVANAENFRKYTSMLAESPIPFLFVHSQSEMIDYNHLIQPIDMRKENSDGSLWCSYFGRFNQAEIVAVAAKDTTKEAQSGVAKNVLLTKKLYQKFSIEHKIYKGTRSSFRNSYEALELAHVSDCNLFVMLGSSSVTPLDYLVGLPERKIIKRAGKLPVMVINPRRDNYILCD
ncbi:MAG TPA: hypothetical protein PK335_06780 [Draconibacterium sp.]|nr:hypothetical protein [Draconibacterium sp.]